ncbi:MAG: hypothetical protein BWY10_01107 [Chloroflexi bacterium ADurb.Bin180]|nr:MAG: hypothetical protein BWY10_01107 [Chloroflexi bacterium ADurb.Bin180]
MRAARRLVRSVDHLAAANHGQLGGTAAHIDHHALVYLQQRRRGRGLVDQLAALEPGPFKDVAGGPHLGQSHTRRVGARRRNKLGTEPLLDLGLQFSHELDGAQIVNYDAVAHNLGISPRTGDGHVVLIEHHHHRVGRTQVHSDVKHTFVLPDRAILARRNYAVSRGQDLGQPRVDERF